MGQCLASWQPAACDSADMDVEVSADERVIGSLDELSLLASGLRARGLRIVLCSGSFDLVHLAHAKYLASAREFGDVLIVGVDDDSVVRRRKGQDRPIVPQAEQIEILSHLRSVDFLYLKRLEDGRYGLIKAIEPDVLVLTNERHREHDPLLAFCGRIETLTRDDVTSTSGRISEMYMRLGDRIGPKLAEVLPDLIDSVLKRG
jgi:D-glycero-beta-D-manno-heptose 1-phosphate adenylyltransferase